ncbi:MAG: hypothetical protein M3046_06185 [Actinomycetota bacterium]|nr:hypothetical protein [Actinomycetota bacterium]
MTAKVRVQRDITYRSIGGENLKLDAYVPAGRLAALAATLGEGPNDRGDDERVIPPVEQPSFDFLWQHLGDVEPSLRAGEPGGRGGDGNNVAPTIAVIIAVLVVGGVVVVVRRRRRAVLTKGS